ncbi:VOC family protein [Angustibacter luteus]|uniref:VOC family protein n=1 Tax=Angustibacter luteus TaxID=658456 RepID=A0ABW1JE18_9ACTN
MSTHETPWPAGTPCWTELSADDAAAARDFYSGLFGWDIDVSGPEFGDYGVARVDGHRVAGVGGKMSADQPSAWTTYLASDDVDATAAAVAEHGGQVAGPPMDIADMGRMIIATDPSGAVFGVWQAGSNTGSGLVNQPGGVVWNEHVSGDFEGSKTFYGNVFGLSVQPMPGAPEGLQSGMLARSGGQVVGSAADVSASSADGAGDGWVTYFAVADTDGTVAKATELGGSVVADPSDAPFGRMAVLAGPEGERFAVVQTPAEGHAHSDTPDADPTD